MHRRRWKGQLLWAAIMALLFAPGTALAAPGGGAGLDKEAEHGEQIFHARCSGCHPLGGGDRPTGPDLAGVTERREREWLLRFITEPAAMLAEDPAAKQLLADYGMPMPDLGVSRAEAEAVLTWLAHPGEAQHHPEKTKAAALAGDPARGEALYVGTLALKEGGAPCLACHGIAGAGLGLAAGASYGPDLTAMWEDYGAEGVASILQSLPFPSMDPIYAAHPLTEEEQRDVAAFLARAEGQTPAKVSGRFALQGGGAAVAFFGVIYLFGRGRLNGVRRPLVAKSGKLRKGEVR